MIHAKMPRGPQDISPKTPYAPLTYKIGELSCITVGRTRIPVAPGTPSKVITSDIEILIR